MSPNFRRRESQVAHRRMRAVRADHQVVGLRHTGPKSDFDLLRSLCDRCNAFGKSDFGCMPDFLIEHSGQVFAHDLDDPNAVEHSRAIEFQQISARRRVVTRSGDLQVVRLKRAQEVQFTGKVVCMVAECNQVAARAKSFGSLDYRDRISGARQPERRTQARHAGT